MLTGAASLFVSLSCCYVCTKLAKKDLQSKMATITNDSRYLIEFISTSGAKKKGVEGFFKGIGRGLIGLLIKPTGGVIDLVTSSLDGVRR